MLRNDKVVKKNVKKIRHHVVKMLQISITLNSKTMRKLKTVFLYYVIDPQILNFKEFEQNLR